MILRAARSTDAGKVGEILSEFIDNTEWMPRIHTRAEDVAHAGEMIKRGWVTVAEQDGKLVGFSACNGPELNSLYIAQNARRLGVGTALLTRLQGEQPRLELWTFQANDPARAFYAKHGFSEVGKTQGDNDEGLPDVQLLWERKGA